MKQKVISHLHHYCAQSVKRELEAQTKPFQEAHRRPCSVPPMTVTASISIASRMLTTTCNWWYRIWMPCYVRGSSLHRAPPDELAEVSAQVLGTG